MRSRGQASQVSRTACCKATVPQPRAVMIKSRHATPTLPPKYVCLYIFSRLDDTSPLNAQPQPAVLAALRAKTSAYDARFLAPAFRTHELWQKKTLATNRTALIPFRQESIITLTKA